MFTIKLATAGLLGFISMSALAQAPGLNDPKDVKAGLTNGDRDSLPRSDKASNIDSTTAASIIAPTLPSPGLSSDAGPRDFLRAARAALVTGHTGEAQQALEMAETRALTASLPQARTGLISDARHALGAGDRARAIELIDTALAS